MSIIRKRSAGHKAYIPNNARDNHYLLAEFPLTDLIINTLNTQVPQAETPFGMLYQSLAKLLFSLSQKYEVTNSLFIANDKLTRVRFSQEMHQWQTAQQILFYYNPAYHELQKSFFDANYRAEKITLLFLATGSDIRVNAASFHSRISQLLAELESTLNIGSLNFRIRDHQHLTYDLFARQKTGVESKAHKMRNIKVRYASQHVQLPSSQRQMTYAIVSIPVKSHLVSLADIDQSSDDPYNPFYTLVTDAFSVAAKRYNLNNGALIANGLIPIVRHSEHEAVSRIGELQMLGYNPELSPCGIISKWDARALVENLQLVFVATKENQSDSAHAKFLNQIELAVKLFATELELSPEQDEIIIRFHQHIAYNLSQID
ncbi:DUF3083 family protein [Thalassotalea sp. M1531]|uniref:DUF3083 family protein n=1 Tax=Thalassotalea algicola TaxID=2716224 RepID=A0A7Y0LDF6_9GAMM|nr:DUF3083 family protein [Thalassotalea algicola]NMP32127.1 DUF3083 family protein [Thalassotalea algicola]